MVRNAPGLLFEQHMGRRQAWVFTGGHAPVLHRGALTPVVQQGQIAQAKPVGPLDHLQEQVGQVVTDARDTRGIERLARIGEVQQHGGPAVYADGQRVVALLMVIDAAKAQVHGRCLQRLGNRIVLEHQDVVEQCFTALPGPALDIEERGVLLLAQRQVELHKRVQPRLQRLICLGAGHHRQGVDEQADLLLHAADRRRASGDGGPEHDAVVPGVALEQQQPGRLDDGVEGDFMTARKGIQALGVMFVQPVVMIMLTCAARCRLQGLCKQGRRRQAGQLIAPEHFAGLPVLAQQPTDVVAVLRRPMGHRLASIALEYFAQKLRGAPAVHQDMVAGVDQVIVLRVGLCKYQPEQRRGVKLEALLQFALRQCVEGGFCSGVVAQVQQAERQLDPAHDHLHGLLELPVEPGAQDGVGVEGGLPGAAKTLRVEPADVQAHLIQVIAAALLVQAMEQHALLHRGQWIDVLEVGRRHRKLVQLRLVQTGQGEVGGRHATCIRGQAVFDQRLQLCAVGIGQSLDGLHIELLAAERPVQAQATVVYAPVEHQPVVQGCVRALLTAALFCGGGEQGVIVASKTAVELAQVVEGDTRCRQRRQGLACGSVPQVAQDTVADTLVGNAAQVLLDLAKRVAKVAGHGQLHREHAGEPTHGTGEVDVVEQLLAAMAFQLDQRGLFACPLADHTRQGGQQQVVDLGAVGCRRLLQQATGLLGIQAGLHSLGVVPLHACIDLDARQVCALPAQLCHPVVLLPLQRRAVGMRLQFLRPGLVSRGLARQFHGLPGQALRVGLLQVLEEDAPRHAIDHQVMDHQQQALAAVGQRGQHGVQQRALGQVQAALGIVAQGGQRLGIGHLALPQQRHHRLAMFGQPALLTFAEGKAQRIVMLHKRLQRLLQCNALKCCARYQQHRLVPVVTLGNDLAEEAVLHRQQRHAAEDGALVDLHRAVGIAHDLGKGAQGLVLEQLLGREVQPLLTGPADHLNGDDRVTAQLEEVVVHPDPLKLQHVLPDTRQLLFERGLGGDERLVAGGLGQRQRFAVDLAARAQRHVIEQHDMGRNHVVRQARLERFAQRLHVCICNQVSNQLRPVRTRLCHDQRLADTGLGQQASLDLAQLDAEATDLHLMVHPADVVDHAIGAVTRQVARAVQAPAVAGERVGQEALGGQRAAAEVATGQQLAADHQLTHDTGRYRLPGIVQQVDLPTRQGRADRQGVRHGLFAQHVWSAVERGGGDRGFRRAVGVEQTHMAQAGLVPGGHAFRGHGFAARMNLTQLPVVAWPYAGKLGCQQVPVRGRQVGHADAVGQHPLVKRLAVPDFIAAQHHGGTADQRGVQLLDEGIEVERGKLQHAIGRVDIGIPLGHEGVAGQGTMADGHALRPTGRAGGEDHVGQVVGVHAVERVAGGAVAVVRRIQQQALHLRVQCQRFAQVRLGQQQRDAAVLDHLLQALLGKFRVERYIAAACLEHGQQGNDHRRIALDGDADQHVGAHALGDQAVRQAVGRCVELGVGQLGGFSDQRSVVRNTPGLLLEQHMGRRQAWVLTGGHAPVLHRGALTPLFEQLQLAQATLGRAVGHLRQEMGQLACNLGNALGTELRSVIAVMQQQVGPGADAQRQRVVVLLMAVHVAKVQVTDAALLQRLGHGVVFEDQQGVEQSIAALPGPALHITQCTVFVVPECQVDALYGL